MDDGGLEGYSMKKKQQAKILEMLETLAEAHGALCKQAVPSAHISLLANCQEFALHIGRYIESIKGEGTNTVVLLEEYCEIAYKTSLKTDVKLQVKRLQKQLVKIKNSVVDELKPDKIEIVFFPYQLSMFDAFESIYAAAKDDLKCEAYVVPIPWFDKLPDGSWGKMHYDGDQYPAHIPIIHWTAYDVATRHPDVIYIHYPYDNGNYVTTVHPDFYSERLRNYTDMLVYIPYFVCNDDVDAHFCTVAGCIYAHKTIVQSEKIRDTYVKAFRDAYGNRFGDPENKFIALGSPKFDAVVNSKTEDFALPESWKRLLFKADGTRKKVILYNTSLGAILENDAQYLRKLRHVFRIFRENDDFVLWWRPHPLSEATYQSMLPHLLREYKQIVAEYKGEN